MIMNGRTLNIGLHLLAWLVFLMLPILISPNALALFEYDSCHFFNYLLTSGLLVLLFYFNYYFAVPAYYFKQEYLSFIGLHITFIIGVLVLVILFNKYNGP